MNKIIQFNQKILDAVKTMSKKEYWNRPNIVEAWGFATKIAIIFPGLLFDKQWWWLYIIAAVTSSGLVWSSTVKTLPTIILFNIFWFILAVTAIIMHFIN
jgi:hypothetical protein